MELKSFFAKDVLPRRPAPRELPCRACTHLNELPYAFCEECGSPRVRLGRFRVMANLTLSAAALFGTYYFAELFAWPWPIYALFAVLYAQIALLFVAESRIKGTRFLLWIVVVLGGLGYFFDQAHSEGILLFVLALRDMPSIASQDPWTIYPLIAAVLVVALLPMYLRWGRVYGWVNAYRIGMLTVFAAAAAILAVFRGIVWLHAREYFPALQAIFTEFVEHVNPKYQQPLALIAVTALRLFLFEIFVFAALRGYSVARKEKLPLDREALRRASAMERSIILMAQIARRFGYAFEQMLRYLGDTVRKLARDFGQVIVAFLRELLLPFAAMVGAAFLLHALALLVDAYIQANTIARIGGIVAIVVGLFLCEAVFLACKSRYRAARVASVHVQIISWLLPNVLVFFLLISVSLWASSKVIGIDNADSPRLPFALGMMTKGVAALLALLATIIVYRKRDLFSAIPEEQGAKPGKSEDLPLFEEQEPAVEDPEDRAEEEEPIAAPSESIPVAARSARRGGWDLGHRGKKTSTVLKILGSLMGTAAAAAGESQLGKKAHRAIGSAQERLKGKPEVLARIEAARARLDEKVRQIGGLENARGSITAEMHSNLLARYQGEAEAASAELAALRGEIDRDYAENMVERTKCAEKLAELQAKLAEYEALHASGGIPAREYEINHSNLKAQMQFHSGALANRDRRLQYLWPYVQPESGRPLGGEVSATE